MAAFRALPPLLAMADVDPLDYVDGVEPILGVLA